MYKQGLYKILVNERLTAAVYRMVLEGDTQYITAPGQFVNILLEGKFLRRPISVCDWDASSITVVYKVVGEGTAIMSTLQPGTMVDMLTGLGNGFSINSSSRTPLLVGGGVGLPPLYNLARQLVGYGKEVSVVIGCNTSGDLFFQREFSALGTRVYVSTVDCSAGTGGFVTDAIRENGINYDYLYACGPMAMLRALADTARSGGQFSFEERMGCGFGACMGCSCRTGEGYKRICREGPVLNIEEIVW